MDNQPSGSIAERKYLVYPEGARTDTIEPTTIAGPRELLEWVLREVGPRALRDFVVTRLPGDRLTTQQAAAFLGMSRPTLIKLLDRGKLPYTPVGNRRYVALVDLAEYQVKETILGNGESPRPPDEVVSAHLRTLLQMAEEEGDFA